MLCSESFIEIYWVLAEFQPMKFKSRGHIYLIFFCSIRYATIGPNIIPDESLEFSLEDTQCPQAFMWPRLPAQKLWLFLSMNVGRKRLARRLVNFSDPVATGNTAGGEMIWSISSTNEREGVCVWVRERGGGANYAVELTRLAMHIRLPEYIQKSSRQCACSWSIEVYTGMCDSSK